MKNQKKLLILFIAILICILVFFVIQIYAKYLTTANGDAEMKIANWNILVNNLSIKNHTDISSSIVPVFPGNENISSGIIAPTAEGYFDLNFDFSGADVSFNYEINTSISEDSPVKDLVATGYSIDDGEKHNFKDFNETISENIMLDSNIKKRKVRIYIMWNDDESTSSMSNEADTTATNSTTPAIFHIDISFKQLK